MDSGPLIQSHQPAFREIPSVFPAEFTRQLGPGGYPSLQPQESLLREYLRVLIKHKWTLVGCVALIFGAVLIATLRSTPIFEAVGSIAINKPDPVLNFRDSNNAAMDYYDPTDLDTEVRILRSDLLALQVIRQLNLDQQPQFGGNGRPQRAGTVGLTTDVLQADSPQTTEALDAFKAALRVNLEVNTRIIDIHFRSPDKHLTSRVVNTLVNTYVEQISRRDLNPPCKPPTGSPSSWWICK